MGLFEGLKDAPMSYGSNFVKAGHYLYYVRSAVSGYDRHGIGYVAINLTVVEQIDVDKIENPSMPGEHVVDLYKKDKDPFLSNIKSLIANIFDEDSNDIQPQHAETLFPDRNDKEAAQPLAGMVVDMQGTDCVSQKSGQPYVRKSYIRAVSVEEALERVGEENLKKYLTKTEYELLITTPCE